VTVAARLYATVTTYYVLATGIVVAGVALFARWGARVLGHHYYDSYKAIPWLALGWALYGLYLIFIVISGRARRTRRNLPAAFVGLVVNVICLVLLVPPLGIAGAGIALVIAYAAMIVAVFGVIAVAGDLLLPTHGLVGFLLRGAAWCLIFPLLRAAGFFNAAELARAGALVTTIIRRRAVR
jgi:O-antigen/teichoic acid export membrane protein